MIPNEFVKIKWIRFAKVMFINTATQELMTSRLLADVRKFVSVAGIVVPFAITVHEGTIFITNVVRFSIAPVYEIHRGVVCPDERTSFSKVPQCNHRILTRRRQQCVCNECILAGRVDGQQIGSHFLAACFGIVPGFFDSENLVTRVFMVMPPPGDVTSCKRKSCGSVMGNLKSSRHTATH